MTTHDKLEWSSFTFNCAMSKKMKEKTLLKQNNDSGKLVFGPPIPGTFETSLVKAQAPRHANSCRREKSCKCICSGVNHPAIAFSG